MGWLLADCGKNVTTTILLVYQQLPQQPGRSLKTRHDAIQFCETGSLGPFPCAQRGPWAPSPFLRAEETCVCGRLLRQAGPVFAQVTPHRDHVMSFWFRPPLPGDGSPLTHSPRREVVSGSVSRRVSTPRLLGVLLWQLGTVSLGCQPGFTDHHVSRLLRLLSQAGVFASPPLSGTVALF